MDPFGDMNPLRFYAERPSLCDDTGYEFQTTYWGDFRVGAEVGGLKGIKETYQNGLELAKSDKIYGTEFSMVLNWLSFFYHNNTKYANCNEKSKLFSDLWLEFHHWVLDHWKGEDLSYYLKTTD